jgi:hypothetical protein
MLGDGAAKPAAAAQTAPAAAAAVAAKVATTTAVAASPMYTGALAGDDGRFHDGIDDLRKYDWFHGAISSQDAYNVLIKHGVTRCLCAGGASRSIVHNALASLLDWRVSGARVVETGKILYIVGAECDR